MPKFSVIIPAYNSQNHICRTLDCLKSQTYRDFETIITDDGSIDNTVEAIRKYIMKNPGSQIVLLTQANKGLGAARNTCISNSRGEYLAFLDDDDIWYPERLEAIADYLLLHPLTDVVSHRVYRTYPDGRKTKYPNSLPEKPYYESLLFKGNTLSVSATVARTECVTSVGGFSEDSRYHGVLDYDMWLKLAYLGCKFGFINRFLGEYTKRADSFSSRTESNLKNLLNLLSYNEELASTSLPLPIFKIKRKVRWKMQMEILSAVFRMTTKKDLKNAFKILKFFTDPKRMVDLYETDM